ncbi:MAG TPA: hypothetical protein PKE69_17165 [Pyrinomonadaceae bacterium]|nr:hypothetical protein [Pyrinomonadaceae bacterium]
MIENFRRCEPPRKSLRLCGLCFFYRQAAESTQRFVEKNVCLFNDYFQTLIRIIYSNISLFLTVRRFSRQERIKREEIRVFFIGNSIKQAFFILAQALQNCQATNLCGDDHR